MLPHYRGKRLTIVRSHKDEISNTQL